jgi:hypothetical protein
MVRSVKGTQVTLLYMIKYKETGYDAFMKNGHDMLLYGSSSLLLLLLQHLSSLQLSGEG